ncbi:MAG: hypothetical protein UW24_C0023G0017 [Parcubacteria group bacterium GW2011_GWA2_44_12]|nr:MAG: hypothetical protein UW24_C0023G0017 [Parcubacteria group bacterium GW2011_GWA2_44_12]
MQKFKRNSGIAFCVFIFLVLFHGASAQISGAQYKIYSPIVTFGAGEGSSQNYAFKELIGEIIAGITSGSSYRLRAGAVYRGVPEVISFSLSKNSIDFGTLTTVQVSEDFLDLSVSSNAAFGYAVMLFEDGNLRALSGDDIDDVSNPPVDAGVEEYGIVTEGADGQLFEDTGITNNLIVAKNSGQVSNSLVRVRFHVSISPVTAAGQYGHIVSFIATSEF